MKSQKTNYIFLLIVAVIAIGVGFVVHIEAQKTYFVLDSINAEKSMYPKRFLEE